VTEITGGVRGVDTRRGPNNRETKMPEDKSDEANVHAEEHQGLPPPEQLDLPEVEALQAKVEALEGAVESLKKEMTRIQIRQMLLKAIVGWKEGEEVPLPEDVLTGIREYAKELGIVV